MRVVAAAGRGRAVQLLRVRFVKALGISAVPDFIMFTICHWRKRDIAYALTCMP